MKESTYIPVPVWNGDGWDPCDFRNGQVLMPWPEGFDPTTLPKPKYQLGETVRFYVGSEIWSGEIREIQLHGGRVDTWQILEKEIQERYFGDMLYTIYARGHGRWVYGKNVI